MPIRTHRGRAAVYRRVWGWPLRSPKHLATAVVLFVAVVVSIGLLLPAAPKPNRTVRPSPHAAPVSAPAPSARPQPGPPSISVPNTPEPVVPPDPAGLATVEAFGRQWAHHPPGAPPQDWLIRLRPFTTDEFHTVLNTVDPANVPATRLVGPPRPVQSTLGAMVVHLPTDAGELRVTVVHSPRGWLISGYDEVR